MMVTQEEVNAEVARIKADPHQMRLVVACMMQYQGFLDSVLAIHTYRAGAADDLANAIEAHVVEHALYGLQLRKQLELIETPAASPSAH